VNGNSDVQGLPAHVPGLYFAFMSTGSRFLGHALAGRGVDARRLRLAFSSTRTVMKRSPSSDRAVGKREHEASHRAASRRRDTEARHVGEIREQRAERRICSGVSLS
jgi:hypothetical protein